jgi:hypothetical protein
MLDLQAFAGFLFKPVRTGETLRFTSPQVCGGAHQRCSRRTVMADADAHAHDETHRLELALERIARLRQVSRPAPAAAQESGTHDVAVRLDAMIADLRAVLKKAGSD